MTAYVVARIEVTDAKAYEAYRAAVPSVIAQFGGRYLVRGGTAEVREGSWKMPRLVILEFDSMDQAKRFYDSPQYQEILPLRLAASRGDLVLVEGIAASA